MINFLNIKHHFSEYHEDKSGWACRYCKHIEDKPEVRKLITDKFWRLNYLNNKDDPKTYITSVDRILYFKWILKQHRKGTLTI